MLPQLKYPTPFNTEIVAEPKPDKVWWHWFLPRIVSSGFIAILVYWIITEQNGFSTVMPALSNGGYLGYHALGMGLWTTIMHQETMLSYIHPLVCSKNERVHRFIHVLFHVIGILCGMGGLAAILWYKQATNRYTLMGYSFYIPYSTHSWLGIGFLAGWAMQCLSKLCPSLITASRYAFLERTVYVLGLTTCSLGIQQMQTQQLHNVPYLINSTITEPVVSTWWFSKSSLGILLLAVSGITTMIVTHL
jgi:hypothetical protein